MINNPSGYWLLPCVQHAQKAYIFCHVVWPKKHPFTHALTGQISLQKGYVLLTYASTYVLPEMFARSIESYRVHFSPCFYMHNCFPGVPGVVSRHYGRKAEIKMVHNGQYSALTLHYWTTQSTQCAQGMCVCGTLVALCTHGDSLIGMLQNF